MWILLIYFLFYLFISGVAEADVLFTEKEKKIFARTGRKKKKKIMQICSSQLGSCSDEECSLILIKQRSMPNVGHSLTTTFLPLKLNCSVVQYWSQGPKTHTDRAQVRANAPVHQNKPDGGASIPRRLFTKKKKKKNSMLVLLLFYLSLQNALSLWQQRVFVVLIIR